MAAYYNEIDPFAAQWLRELIKAGLIADGEVDERSIEDVLPSELADFSQCHFFAGIGVWSYALRQAGWPDDRPIWTGSCPCQPFSAAGKRKGFADERHLWPAFHWLITQCRPGVVIGEQVASKDGLAWLDLVQSDMEASFYGFGAFDICAAGFGAPHIRQRLYWVAYADSYRCGSRKRDDTPARYGDTTPAKSHACGMAHAMPEGLQGGDSRGENTPRETVNGFPGCGSATNRPGPTNGFWRDADWLFCRDGKWRPVKPGTFPLAHGSPARVGRLRGYGNALNALQAHAFIEAVMEVL